MKNSSLLQSCLLGLFMVLIRNSESKSAMVHTSSGSIQGSVLSVNGRRVYQFLGIPYAQPPLGYLRFRKPLPIQPWAGILNANTMPPACIQFSELPFPWYDFQPGKSEDCLYLNIWVPETKDSETKKSVMIWFHGGVYAYGSTRIPVYNGRVLAAEGSVIIVTVNYRLGAFGFFTTNTDAAPVNNGLYDMLEAMKWVNKNIGAFGGDPNQVTLFGESAGAWSIGFFCVSPLSKGLFNRVIMESGSPATVLFDPNTTSLITSQNLAQDLGCTDLATNVFTFPDKVADCMRGMDAFKIAQTLNSYDPNLGRSYLPVYGNELLPDNVRENIIAGKFHDVSVLIGNNRDEGSFFLTAQSPELLGFFGENLSNVNGTVIQYLLQEAVKKTLENIHVPGMNMVIQTILKSIKTADHRKNIKLAYDFLSDFLLICPAVYFAESYSKYGKNTYFYFLEHRPSVTPWAEWMGVVHDEEVQFVFGSPLENNRYTGEEAALSKLMIKIWTNFAKYGDPLHDESEQTNSRLGDLFQPDLTLRKWPIYSRQKPLYLVLDETTRKVKRYDFGPHKTNCDLFRAINGFL